MASQKTINEVNGLDLDTLGETIEALRGDPELGRCRFKISNKWTGAASNCSTVTSFYAAKQDLEHKQPFKLRADEPPMLSGADEAPNPVEHLLNALTSCMTTSLVSHAAVRGIHIDELESEVEGDIDLNGFLGLSEDVPKGYKNIRVTFKVKSDENTEKLRELAKFSPVYNTLINGVNVDVEVEKK